jgi:hypothetical protein
VAYFWSQYLREEPGKTRLQEFVAKKFGTDKKVEVIDFADGAWYQPQSLIATLLYGRNLDLAISVEGANELRRALLPDFPMDFPRARFTQIYFSNTFEAHVNLLLIDLTIMTTETLENWAQAGWLPSLNKVTSLSIKKIMRARLFEQTKVVTEPEKLSALWFESWQEQGRIFRDRSVPHFLIVQPFPCINDPAEALKDEYCADYDNKGVLALQQGLASFRQSAALNKVPFVDLSEFHKMDHQVYFDDLHFTPEGQKIFTDKILKTVAEKPINKKPSGSQKAF